MNPNITWARQMLAAATDLIGAAGRELADLLAAARVETPAELLDRWKKYQALLLRQESLVSQLQEHKKRLDDLLVRRRAPRGSGHALVRDRRYLSRPGCPG